MRSVPIRLVVALVVLTASACGSGTAQKAVADVKRNASGKPLCPLTGEPADREADAARPAIAVKVENSPQARPQAGLEAADLVYEEPVEGGLAWLIALFQCSDPAMVGPVRHVHPSDPLILAGHLPTLFVHAGASKSVAPALESVKGLQWADGAVGGKSFQRVQGRPVPHNLFASMSQLRQLAKGEGAPRPWAKFTTQEDAPKAEASPTRRPRAASSAHFMQGAASIRWTWDKAAESYSRKQGSAPFTDDSGRPVTVANVVFLWVPMSESETRDAAGNRTPELSLTGKGDALVLHSGEEHSGRWVRTSLSDPPSLVDRKGRPMVLPPGPSWIHLVPVDSPVFVR